MSKPNHWHPCFLPDDYRERLKQYQADFERGVEDNRVGSVADEVQEPACGQVTEGTDWQT